MGKLNIAKVKMTKKFIVDAIIGGIEIPMGGFSNILTPFCGNQWNEDWKWDRDELNKMTLDELINFYNKHK